MKSFFKYLLATILGVLITGLAMIILFMVMIGSMVASKDKPFIVKENSVLEIDLSKPVADRSSDNPLDNFDYVTMKPVNNLGLNDIIESIEKAKTDDNIKGIYLKGTVIPSGVATIEEIRNALIDFRDSEKFIFSYGDLYGQKSYYLSTVSDKIFVNPQGVIEYKGLRAELMFFKGALEKLGVEPVIIRGRNNKFKSAVEPFMYDRMSDANRKQIRSYMGSVWDYLLKNISEQRGMSVDDLMYYADSLLIKNPKEAIKYKMIDGVKYYDQFTDEMKKHAGLEEDDELNLVSLSDYKNAPGNEEDNDAEDKIAVIYASGEIGMGEGSDKSIGSEGLSKAVREARLDSTIKSIVLRINSPGGSALASEVIWREVYLAKKEKPVIVSMGDVAASGGYYIATHADVIVAHPNTITGSIGVFGMFFNGQELLNDKLGITVDTVLTNTYSDLGSQYRPMAKAEYEVIQEGVEDIYDVFISHVSEGRNMTKADVDSIGQGRVWSGVNAKKIGLIDEFGGLNRAIDIAAEKAGLKKYKIIDLPEQEDFMEKILNDLSGQASGSIIKEHLGESYRYYKNLQDIIKTKGIQARMPFYVEVY